MSWCLFFSLLDLWFQWSCIVSTWCFVLLYCLQEIIAYYISNIKITLLNLETIHIYDLYITIYASCGVVWLGKRTLVWLLKTILKSTMTYLNTLIHNKKNADMIFHLLSMRWSNFMTFNSCYRHTALEKCHNRAGLDIVPQLLYII